METIYSKDGTPIAYERTGAGSPLVLVHGTTADHTRWAPLLPQLGQHFTVLALDRRGRGHSGDADSYALEREFEDIVALVDSIGEPVDLLGHSFGALCALEAAVRTNHLRKLVLYEPPFSVGQEDMYPPGARERLQALLDEGDREKLLQVFLREIVHMPPEEIAVLRAEPAWQARISAAHTLVREMADADYIFEPQRFRRLTTPTLLLVGGNSPSFLTAPSKILASVLPNSRIVVMPGQGHAAMSTAPDLFLSEVIGFLTTSI